jgi:hypothetical protein
VSRGLNGSGPSKPENNMVDLILLSFALGTFAGGFWCGKKFGTVGAMLTAGKARVKSWLA